MIGKVTLVKSIKNMMPLIQDTVRRSNDILTGRYYMPVRRRLKKGMQI